LNKKIVVQFKTKLLFNLKGITFGIQNLNNKIVFEKIFGGTKYENC